MNAKLRTFLTWLFGLTLAFALVWTGMNAKLISAESRTATTAGETTIALTSATEPDAVPADQWVTLRGTVEAYEDNELTIRTTAGDTLTLGLGPLGYWLGHSIAFTPGDEVEVRGFYSADEFEPAVITNLTTGEQVTLRDEEGSPVWRGATH